MVHNFFSVCSLHFHYIVELVAVISKYLRSFFSRHVGEFDTYGVCWKDTVLTNCELDLWIPWNSSFFSRMSRNVMVSTAYCYLRVKSFNGKPSSLLKWFLLNWLGSKKYFAFCPIRLEFCDIAYLFGSSVVLIRFSVQKFKKYGEKTKDS